MKLHYFKGFKNFGDELNPWLWQQLLPGVFDEDESTIFVGIGTLLNTSLPKAHQTIVFGAGVGYCSGPPKVNDSWKIYCVRGPLSANVLGISEQLALTDGAILLRRLFKPTGKKLHRFAYMPHASHANYSNQSWQLICKRLGFGYINPRSSIDKVLTAISETEILLTEAMHGAIVADALRVPWIPIRTTPEILAFKWQDWCASMNLEYQPKYLLPVWDISNKTNKAGVIRYRIKKQLSTIHLAIIANTSQPLLSDDAHLEKMTVALEEKVEKFKDDLAKGLFHST